MLSERDTYGASFVLATQQLAKLGARRPESRADERREQRPTDRLPVAR
jgi:hypothetical protein